MIDLSDSKKFFPWIQSRKSEFANWGILIVFILILLFLPTEFLIARRIVLILLPVFILIATMISFSNLLDRHTSLTLNADSIEYSSLLRKAKLKWAEIERVQVIPLAWNEKVFVIGKDKKISFITEGKVEINNRINGKSGFSHGNQILDTVLNFTGLSSSNKIDQDTYYYYQKE